MEALTKLRWASRKAADKRAVFAAGGYDIDAQLEEQFRAQEGGRCVTPQQIATEFAGWVDSPAPPCPAALPTLLELEHLCRRQQAAKAPGPDLILNELWRAFPAYAGQWFWQVCTQIALTGHEPFHFKMALICALYKKGPAALPQNYRSIALLNGMAKVWHSHLRTTVGQSVLKGYSPFQLGGRRGIPVGFAVSAYRCAAELSHAAGRSLAILFIDIQAAYYEASRRLVFQGDDLAAPDEGLCREHLAPLALELLRSGALEAIGMPVEERHLLQDWWSARTGDSSPPNISMLPLEDHGQGTASPMLFLEPCSLWPCGIFAASVLLKALLTTRSGRLLALMERSYSWDGPMILLSWLILTRRLLCNRTFPVLPPLPFPPCRPLSFVLTWAPAKQKLSWISVALMRNVFVESCWGEARRWPSLVTSRCVSLRNIDILVLYKHPTIPVVVTRNFAPVGRAVHGPTDAACSPAPSFLGS